MAASLHKAVTTAESQLKFRRGRAATTTTAAAVHPFTLVEVHACVLAAVQEALAASDDVFPLESTEAIAPWVSPLLDGVALALLLRDGEVKRRAMVSVALPWGEEQRHDGHEPVYAEAMAIAQQHVRQELHEGSWVLWYILRVVGLMSWWDAVLPTLVAPQGGGWSLGLHL